jgi:signal transduction histidine kinase
VLNTLTALTRAGSSATAEVVSRCQHDVSLMEYALSDPGGPAAVADGPFGGLLAGLEAVATQMRARGLTVHLEATSGVPARDSGPGESLIPREAEDVRAVPVVVADAITHAAREALTNVAIHAGTREAWVEVSLDAPGGDAAAPGGLRVTVRDGGTGFHPDRVDPARLGLRRSVIERIADWGGQASIQSAPGQGTVVRLCWPAPPPEPAAAAGRGLGQLDLPW